MMYSTNCQAIKDSGMTFSLVIETENLGMAGLEDLYATLDCLMNQTYSIAHANEVLVIIGGTVSENTLSTIAHRYQWVTIHQESRKLEYLESKIQGAKIATGDVLVCADSDAVYEPQWLESMLYGFIAAPGATIIASETRIKIRSIYTAALQLMWMINAVRNTNTPKFSKLFHLNNFAIKRHAMITTPYFKGYPVYRGNNIEWKKQLLLLGYSIVRVPGLLSHHAPPGNFWDFWYRMLILGADPIAKADFYYFPNGGIQEKFSPFRRVVRVPLFFGFKVWVMMTRIYTLVMENNKNIPYVIAGLPVAMIFLLLVTIGSCVTVFNRGYLFRKIMVRENSHVV